MVLDVTFGNISVISWWSVLLEEETGVPGKNHRTAKSTVLLNEDMNKNTQLSHCAWYIN
jgi:hypothetical protein